MRQVFLGIFVLVSLLSSAAWGQVSVSYGSSPGTFTIQWDAGIGMANVRESKDGGYESEVFRGSGNSVTLTGRSEGSYRYRVIAEELNCIIPGFWCDWVQFGEVTVTVAPPDQVGVPSSLSVSSPATGSYTVSWGQASGNVTSYTLQENYMLGSWQTIYSGTARSRSFDKSPGQVYQYRVRACGVSSCSAYTPAQTVSIPNASLSASISPDWVDYTNSTFTLSWNSSLTTDCSWSRGSISGTSGSVQASVSAGWEDFAFGQYRNISTVTCNVKGGGTISENVTVHAQELPPTPDVNVSWNKSSAYVGQSATLSWSTEHASSCTLDGGSVSVNGSRSYTFSNDSSVSKTVSCQNGNGSGADSATISVSYQAPGIPSSLSAPSTANTGVYSVTWGSASGTVTAYQLQERLTGGSWSTVQSSTSRSRSFTKTTPNRRYEYRVRACNHNACSGYRGVSQVHVPHASVTASLSPSTVNYTNDTITLTWSSIMTSGCSWSEGSVSGTSGSVSKELSGWVPVGIDELHRKNTTVTCTKIGGGTVAESVEALAQALPPLPEVSTSWSTNSAHVGQSATLSWSANHADSCTLDGSSVPVNGSRSFNFTTDTSVTKTVSCQNGNGSGSDSATIAVSYSVPGVPGGISAPLNSNSTSYTVSWEASSGAVTRYELEENDYQIYLTGLGWGNVQSSMSRSRSFSKALGSGYVYRVRACNHSSCSAYSEVVQVVIPEANLTASVSPSFLATTNTPVTLTWDSTMTTNCNWSAGNISGTSGNSSVVLSGWVPVGIDDIHHVVSTLTCDVIGGGSISETFNHSASALPPMPTVELWWSAPGHSVSLHWNSLDAVSCDINGVSVSAEGSQNYVFNDIDFSEATIECANMRGSAVVSVPIPIPTVNASWSSTSVTMGQTATVTWESHGATNCSLEGDSVPRSGSRQVTMDFAGETTRTITCSNASGSAASSASLHVYRPSIEMQENDPANDAIAGSLYFGKTPGEHRVGKGGSFSYSVPIDVAPGINGLQPKVSLDYNSSTQNGLMGWGWNISGLSSISRCPASFVRDGYASGISNDDAYKYCLDGQRLVPQPDGTYRTESESFKRITKNVDSWTVENPDGSALYYGSNTDLTYAKSLGVDDETISWLVDKQSDTAGNYMTFIYDHEADNGHVVIKEIQYTKNDSAQSQSNAVRFYYQDRDDIVSSYSANTLFTVDQRLYRVEVVASDTLIYVYDINYETNNGLERADPVATSRVSSIAKCFGGDISCATPLVFDWSSTHRDNYVMDASDQSYELNEDISADRYFDTSEDFEVSFSNTLQASTGGRLALLDQGVRGDFDGDNKQEVVWTEGTLRFVSMSASDPGHVFADIPPAPLEEELEGGLFPQPPGAALDFNGDGLDDFYIKRLTSLRVYISDGSTLVHSPAYSMTEEQLGVEYATICCDLNDDVTKHWQYNYVMRDIDGDSLIDILRMPMWDDSSVVATISDLGVDDISVARNNGNGFDAFERWATSTDFTFLNKRRFYSYLSVADVNGDALLDLVGLDGEVGINTGTSFTHDASWANDINLPHLPDNTLIWVNAASVPGDISQVTGGGGTGEPIPGYGGDVWGYRLVRSSFSPFSSTTRAADVNGDGLMDIVAVRFDGIYVALSTGASFLPAELWTDALTYHDLIPFCDMVECNSPRRTLEFQDANRDGMADILYTRAWTDIDPMQNASDILVLFSKGRIDEDGNGFTAAIEVASVAPRPEGTEMDPSAERLGKPYVTEEGDLVIHRQPGFWAEALITLGIRFVEAYDVAIKIGIEPHKILTVHESDSRRLEVEYRTLSDTEVYAQTGVAEDDSTLGHSTPNTYTFYGSDGQVSELPDHSVHSAARGQRIAASIGIYEHDTLAAHESYFYKNRRSHRRGLGSLGFEEIQKTTTLAGQSQHLRTITEYLQEVGNEASYILAAPERTVNCVINALDAQGCESASGTTVLSEHTQNWQVRVYDNDSPRFHAYAVEEYTQNYDLHSGEQVNTISKRLYNDDVRSSCPALSSIDASNRAITTDVHFDAYGTPLDSVENRCDTFGVTGTHTDNDNVLNDTTNWCLNLTQDANVHRWIYDSGSDTTDSLTRHTHFTYLSSGAGKCQVDIETREPNGGNDIWLQQDYGYNAYGTRTSVQETVRHFTNDGIGFTQRTSSLTETYTSDGSRTMVTANAEGHSTTQTFNAAFGAVTRTLDANGLASDYYYDIAGRLDYSESLGVTTTYDYRSCDNCFTYNSNATHYVQEKTEGQSAQRVYFDDHNREVGKRWRGLNGDFYFTGQKYNALGQADTQTEPFAAGADTSALETTITYDVLGRPIDTHFASGAEQSVEYTVVDGAAAVITTDSLLHTKTQRYDALGREKSVQDALGTYVHYWHDALGSVNQVRVTAEAERETVTSDAVTHHIVFDALGRKTQLIDPDVGSLSYTYNAFGKLTEQINGEGERICYFYDRLDRQIQRRDNANGSCADGTVHTWTFDRPGELGLLAQVSGRDTANRVQSEVYDYTLDTLLPETVTSVIDGDSYTVTNIYDAFLRPAGVVYPTGFTVQPRYNDYGHAHEQVNAASGDVLWQASEDDARGNITLATFGNGAQVQSTFTAHNGLLATRVATLGATTLQNHTYSFDDEGNLRSRTDARVNITQNFCYDPLYRLTDQVIGSACSDDLTGSYSGTAYAYDIHGNLTRKDGINDYHYGQSAQNAGPHAVSYANGGEYIYDDAGRMIGSPLGRTLTYSAFGKPTYMGIVGTYETKILYGAMQRRVEREDYENGETTRTIYIGKQYERIDNPDGTREHRHYLGDWGIHVTEENSSNNTESYNVYLTRDHIGSVASKSDDRSTPTVKYHANEPWGRRQNEAWNGVSYDTLSGAQLKDMTFGTTRGFTDHEHLDGIGLIHMNGRVYDPVVGRFVSPDPWIQDPENSQSFNRYSYVWNNPLRYTDPTGEYTEEEKACGSCSIIYFSDSSSQQAANTPTDVSSSQNQTSSGTPATTGANLESSNTEPAGEPAPTQGQGGTEAQQDLAANQTEQAGDVTETADNLGADTPEFNTENTGDDGEIESWDTIEDAREAAYKRLPYGDDVENEWGVVIYKKGEKFYLSDLIEGDKASVPFKFLQDTATGDAYTKEGHRIAEFAHTHPVKGLQENHLFSRKVSSSNLGDVGIAEDHNTPVSMRHKNTIRLYDPATERPAKDSFGFRNSPGKVICSGDCF